VLGFFNESRVGEEISGVSFIACIKIFFQLGKADFQPFLLEDICESAFRQPTLKRHLSAFRILFCCCIRSAISVLIPRPAFCPNPNRVRDRLFFLCVEPSLGFKLFNANAIFLSSVNSES
jgi:hypothetical protein